MKSGSPLKVLAFTGRYHQPTDSARPWRIAAAHGRGRLLAPHRVLKALKIPPAPQRRTGTTWRSFLRAQADFFHVDCAVTPQRKRDMIVSGGFNIFPFEIEQVLLSHPAIQYCAVIAVPDPKWGEAVKACIELKPAAAVTEAELVDTCKNALGSMKAPKSVDFVDALPRSPVGKVLKRVLREPHWAGRARQVS